MYHVLVPSAFMTPQTVSPRRKTKRAAQHPPKLPLPSSLKQDRLAYIAREIDAKAWEFWGCVLHFVAKLDSPFPIPLPTYERLW